MREPQIASVPAVVVSGFLGSGKTTLVRHVLEGARAAGVRVAVVSNELGELGIDRALLGQGAEAFVELEGGCVCCELSDDLIQTLQMLRERVDPERIVIETSGVALPFDTTLNFWRDPVRQWIGDDVAVVVVNAEQLSEGRDLEGTFEDQVSSADLLILNKIDLLEAGALESARARLREIEPEAPILTCAHGAIPTEVLFPPEPRRVDRSGAPPVAPPHGHEQFSTREWRVPAAVTPEQLAETLTQHGILRAKGWVTTTAGVRLVQVVGHRVELTAAAPPDPDLLDRVVIIERVAQP